MLYVLMVEGDWAHFSTAEDPTHTTLPGAFHKTLSPCVPNPCHPSPPVMGAPSVHSRPSPGRPGADRATPYLSARENGSQVQTGRFSLPGVLGFSVILSHITERNDIILLL